MKKGFTFIDLAMVMVILGILAAVVVPTVFKLHNEVKKESVKGGLGGSRSDISPE